MVVPSIQYFDLKCNILPAIWYEIYGYSSSGEEDPQDCCYLRAFKLTPQAGQRLLLANLVDPKEIPQK